MPPGISTSDFYYILPELVLTAGALLVLIADVALPRSSRGMLSWITMAVIAATLVSLAPFIDRLQTSVDRVVVRINPDYRAPAVAGLAPGGVDQAGGSR